MSLPKIKEENLRQYLKDFCPEGTKIVGDYIMTEKNGVIAEIERSRSDSCIKLETAPDTKIYCTVHACDEPKSVSDDKLKLAAHDDKVSILNADLSKTIKVNICDKPESASESLSKNLKRNVVNPPHYTDGKIEVIDFIEDKKLGFCLGNVVKYVSRCGKKSGNTRKQDLQKALWYLTRELKSEVKDVFELDSILNSIRIKTCWNMCETESQDKHKNLGVGVENVLLCSKK